MAEKNNYFLAIDIGASSGRHILGWIEDNKMVTEEVFRFKNGYSTRNNHKCWNHDELFSMIITGMKKCKEIGKIPTSVSVDTWGVDFVLLDEDDNMIGDTVSYRDNRTEGMDEKVFACISEDELYSRAGIQKTRFNTIYQLMAVKQKYPQQLIDAKTLLFTPDYFLFKLSGKKNCDYTMASTSNLLNAANKDWDNEIIERCGFPRNIFLPLSLPGTELGELIPEIAKEVGYSCKVLSTTSHDTASAVVAVPTMEETVYISSGTWSLMGIESENAICTEIAHEKDMTNEGGREYRYRFLKNIMGLWMIQNVKKEYNDSYSFDELCNMAQQSDIKTIVDCNDNRFLAPDSMITAIKEYCVENNLQPPQTPGEVSAVVYNSLADYYAKTIKGIEEIVGRTYENINIVGGGCKDEYLNELTAITTGKKVVAGPVEATAIGNITTQMIGLKELKNLTLARQIIKSSFQVKVFK